MTDTTDDTVVIDRARALESLERAVAMRGREFRYNELFGAACDYVASTRAEYRQWLDEGMIGERPPEQCACIVGVALHGLGMPMRELRNLRGAIWQAAGYDAQREDPSLDPQVFLGAELFPGVANDDLADAGFRLTPNALRLYWLAQLVQDEERTWGEALDAAAELNRLLEAADAGD